MLFSGASPAAAKQKSKTVCLARKPREGRVQEWTEDPTLEKITREK
jgi:hypothetical protein